MVIRILNLVKRPIPSKIPDVPEEDYENMSLIQDIQNIPTVPKQNDQKPKMLSKHSGNWLNNISNAFYKTPNDAIYVTSFVYNIFSSNRKLESVF